MKKKGIIKYIIANFVFLIFIQTTNADNFKKQAVFSRLSEFIDFIDLSIIAIAPKDLSIFQKGLYKKELVKNRILEKGQNYLITAEGEVNNSYGLFSLNIKIYDSNEYDINNLYLIAQKMLSTKYGKPRSYSKFDDGVQAIFWNCFTDKNDESWDISIIFTPGKDRPNTLSHFQISFEPGGWSDEG